MMSVKVGDIGSILSRYKRVAIAGGPRTGKTTLSSGVRDRRVVHTDDWMHLGWDDLPSHLMTQVSGIDSFAIEGVQVPRALRKGLSVDAVIWMDQPKMLLSAGQRTMANGVRSVFREWEAANNGKVPIFRR